MSGLTRLASRWHECPECGKRTYVSRDVARAVRNRLGGGVSIYGACEGAGYHLGHKGSGATRAGYRRRRQDG